MTEKWEKITKLDHLIFKLHIVEYAKIELEAKLCLLIAGKDYDSIPNEHGMAIMLGAYFAMRSAQENKVGIFKERDIGIPQRFLGFIENAMLQSQFNEISNFLEESTSDLKSIKLKSKLIKDAGYSYFEASALLIAIGVASFISDGDTVDDNVQDALYCFYCKAKDAFGVLGNK